MKLAAASLLVDTHPAAAKGVAVLEAAQGSAGTEADNLNIELALMNGYSNTYQFEKLLAISSELSKKYPESQSAFFMQTYALRALGRFDEANQIAQDKLKRMPNDLDAMRELVFIATSRGDYAAAHDLTQRIIDTGKADASDFNGIAWAALFTGTISEADLQDAIRSAQMSQNDPNVLHTLGCVYAEMGKTKEAREVLVQGMERGGLDEPNSSFWFAFGRIAEQYGEREIALADYARVTKPNRDVQIPNSTYLLAQNRLKVLKSQATASAASVKTRSANQSR